MLSDKLTSKRNGKNKIIAETGAGSTWSCYCNRLRSFDMDCEVFMGEEDIERQKPNVERMQL